MKVKTIDAAKGKWRGILKTLGVPDAALTGKHVPCPLCGGQDRFRFTNVGGNGDYICNQCGTGSGMQLLMRVKGWQFPEAAGAVDAVIGNVEPDKTKPALSPERRSQLLNELWAAGTTISETDLAGRYLLGRNLALPQNRQDVRFVPRCRDPEGVMRPAMVAMVRGPDGSPVNLHRTFLGPDGGKADMDNPRALMPGETPAGSAIRLAMHGDCLGIGEGIETALKATSRFGVPTWSAINATMLAKWQPPETVKAIAVFGDNDANFAGAAAAYTLAHRQAVKGLTVEVSIPARTGADWADDVAA